MKEKRRDSSGDLVTKLRPEQPEKLATFFDKKQNFYLMYSVWLASNPHTPILRNGNREPFELG
jgi:hypothetical protein